MDSYSHFKTQTKFHSPCGMFMESHAIPLFPPFPPLLAKYINLCSGFSANLGLYLPCSIML